MKDNKDIVKEAVRDAQALKEAAIEAAKYELIEGLTPHMRRLLEKEIRTMGEDSDRLRRGKDDKWPGESHTNFEEGKNSKGDEEMFDDKKDEVEESVSGFFPQFEDVDLDDPMGEAKIDTLEPDEDEDLDLDLDDEGGEEKPAPKKKKKSEDEVEESFEISTEALQKAYNEALQLEVQLKKGFSDMSKSGELDEVDPNAGLLDVKKGESFWEKEEPPAKQDFTVKEAIEAGMRENKMLRSKLKEASSIIKQMARKLHETNLFNSKVLYTNKILTTERTLTKEQKMVVLESMDKAKSISEVKLAFETISRSLKAVSNRKLQESAVRRPSANAQRVITGGSADKKVLSESVDRETTVKYSRLQKLAGLLK